MDEARLRRTVLGREVRLIRHKTGLSQPQFAARDHISVARPRDYEQARSEPDFPVGAYLRLIVDYPEVAERLVGELGGDGAAV